MRDIKMVSRRRFVGVASAASAAIAISSTSRVLAADALLRETADLITGPFYPQLKPRDSDIDMTMIRGHRQRAIGQVVQISGRVLNTRGEPVRNAPVEIWQANSVGRYKHPSDHNVDAALDPDFQGYARLRTDRDGRYSFTTIKPGAYPTPRGDLRAPHIHFEIEGVSDRKVTQLFFPNESLNATDRHLNSVRRPESVIANVSSAASGGSVIVATWDVVLSTG